MTSTEIFIILYCLGFGLIPVIGLKLMYKKEQDKEAEESLLLSAIEGYYGDYIKTNYLHYFSKKQRYNYRKSTAYKTKVRLAELLRRVK